MSTMATIKKWMDAIKEFAGTIQIMTVDNETVICKNCKNSKIIVEKDGKTYEYSYDENGKQTVEIK
jgi:hypothetical protein